MKTILYFRVSTAQQGRSGLGLEAQRNAVERYCRERSCTTLGEYTEIESGKRNDRTELKKALHHAKVTGSTLLIAKLDRLSRNAAFLITLRDSGTKFVAVDMPDANDLTIGIMALIAQQEREAISTRTREALAAAKARGTRLGNPNGARALRRAAKGNSAAIEAITGNAQAFATDLAPVIAAIRADGVTSLRGIARELAARKIVTARGGSWSMSTVRSIIARV